MVPVPTDDAADVDVQYQAHVGGRQRSPPPWCHVPVPSYRDGQNDQPSCSPYPKPREGETRGLKHDFLKRLRIGGHGDVLPALRASMIGTVVGGGCC
jgi:hypothetical protein